VAAYWLATHDWNQYPVKIEFLTRLGQAIQAPLPTLPGPRLHPNIAGGLLAMLWPFATLAMVQGWRQLRIPPGQRSAGRWLLFLVGLGSLALASFGLLMTMARGAWLALAGALFLAGVWAAVATPRRRAGLLAAVLVLPLATALIVGFLRPDSLLAVAQLLPGPATGLGRMELLHNSLTLLQDYPFIGAGLGTFQMLYSSYVMLLHVGFVTHSHNLLLDVAIEQGLPGAAILVWMWLSFFAASWRRLWEPGRHLRAGVLGAATIALIVILAHGLVDDALYSSGGVLLLFAPLAFAPPPARRASWPRRGLAVGLAVTLPLLAALALVWHRPLLSGFYSNLGAVHQSQAELSLYSWPEWPIQDAVRRSVDLRRPVAEFEQALAWDPANPTAHRRLGMIELSLGEYETALANLQAAFRREAGSQTTRQLLGEALIANGQIEQGRALWSTVSNAQMQLDIRVFWYEYIGDTERSAWMQQAASDR
jgi:hypothetical protein